MDGVGTEAWYTALPCMCVSHQGYCGDKDLVTRPNWCDGEELEGPKIFCLPHRLGQGRPS